MVSLNTLTRTPKTTTVGSMLPASPNLYIMRSGGQQFYVNGVKVSKRNLQATSDVGRKKQVLHVVEGVLQPLTPKKRSDSDRYIDLTAGKLIRQAGDYDLGKHSVRWETHFRNPDRALSRAQCQSILGCFFPQQLRSASEDPSRARLI